MKPTLYDIRIQSPLTPGETTTPKALIAQAELSAKQSSGLHFEIYEMRGIEQLGEWLKRLDDEREQRILYLAAKRRGWDLSPAHVAAVTQAYDEAMSEIQESQI